MEVPEAPWATRMTAVMWLQRMPAGAAGLRARDLGGLAWLGAGPAGFVFYEETPVGPYAEVFAAPGLLTARGPVGHVPFMAVDSEESVRGGRGNWALPKEVARFERTRGGVAVSGETWTAEARATARGRRFPAAAGAVTAQLWDDGRARRFATRFRGHVRAATVEVRSSRGTEWLPPGRRPAVLLAGTLDVGRPSH